MSPGGWLWAESHCPGPPPGRPNRKFLDLHLQGSSQSVFPDNSAQEPAVTGPACISRPSTHQQRHL